MSWFGKRRFKENSIGEYRWNISWQKEIVKKQELPTPLVKGEVKVFCEAANEQNKNKLKLPLSADGRNLWSLLRSKPT